VHLQEWPEVDAAWKNPELGLKWNEIRSARDQVNEAIEPLRREKTVRSSLEAEITMNDLQFMLSDLPTDGFAEYCIVADVKFEPGFEGISVTPTTHHKCGRCWRHLPEVTDDGALCGRCEDILAE